MGAYPKPLSSAIVLGTDSIQIRVRYKLRYFWSWQRLEVSHHVTSSLCCLTDWWPLWHLRFMSLFNFSTMSLPLLPYYMVGGMESWSPETHMQSKLLHSGARSPLNGVPRSGSLKVPRKMEHLGYMLKKRDGIGISFSGAFYCCPWSVSNSPSHHLWVNLILLLCKIHQSWDQDPSPFPFLSVPNSCPDPGLLQWWLIVHTPPHVLFHLLMSSLSSYSDLQPFRVSACSTPLDPTIMKKWHAYFFLLGLFLSA